MKIIHTADWHLGQTFYGYDRSKEHALFLDWLCSIIKERSIDLLLIAGDIFDTPNPSAEAQRMYYHFLKRVTQENEGLQIIATAGNHDSAARIEAPSPLLNVFNVHVSGVVHYRNEEIDYDSMIIPIVGNGCCLAVPYLRHNDHPEAESYSKGVAKMYSALYERAREKGYSPIIAMGHLQASGAEVSVGDTSEHAVIGGMEGIETGFADEGIIYTALGHLHKAQRVGRKENIRYSGAPLPMSFAELRNNQGVTEVTIVGNNVSHEHITFDTPVKLLSIPAKPQPIDTVLEEIAALPSGEPGDNTPFLEIKVLVTTIDPSIRQRIDDALRNKTVRLANIAATSNIGRDNGEGRPMTYDEFKRTEPLDLIKEIYKRGKKKDMPEHIEKLLTEVINELKG
ncbi:MAG: exonuclease SbcCD subunit D C-terminal domain-containing protein [Bacteroidaceae bacterium]|nr:exonuclease SbcCD subunit D C-terminal domain-containing protein [Bacteroidaceae bacterium]